MRAVATRFRGRTGVVLHVGDSITYSNPYGQWARHGKGKTEEDRAILEWMHTGRDDDTDGWWLCRFDHPDGGRSHTAAGGLETQELLAGGRQGLPSLADMLRQYEPQALVLLIGTNDVSHGHPSQRYRADLDRAVSLILDQGVVLVLSTIPPHPGQTELGQEYNRVIRQMARARRLPLIDYEQEILSRRPDDWNGTLLGLNDVHPTAARGDVVADSEPTPENLRESGYLLRGWLSVRKLAEVKRLVFDNLPELTAEKPARTSPRAAAPRPRGDAIRLTVTRDTWFSNVGQEAVGNQGGAGQLKVKSIQEMSLVDFDPAALRGRTVSGAILHLRPSGREVLRRVTVGTFSSDWVEGTATNYAPQAGSSTFNTRQHPDVSWAFPGSNLCEVILGRGGSLWRMADASPPDEQGWQEVPVDPAIVAARVAGLSYGLFVFDDTGSEWSRDGERFTQRIFPNRFIYSREAGRERSPFLTVYLGEADTTPPAAPERLAAEVGELPAGEVWLTWITPEDQGAAGTVGFFVEVNGLSVPRYLIPAAGPPEKEVTMHLRDLGLTSGAKVAVAVRAVDGAGNVGPAATQGIAVSSRAAAPLPGEAPRLPRPGAKLPRLGTAEIAVIDALDKIHPVSGEVIPRQPEGYLSANHLWSAADKAVRLYAARNEFVDFQVLVRGRVQGMRASLTLNRPTADIDTHLGRYHYVKSQQGPLPDPIVPLAGPIDVPATDDRIAGQTSGSLLGEIYVSHAASSGEHRGTLRLATREATLEIPVILTVWDFTLPDFLSFIPEMNCYIGFPGDERAYYRLAHRHRTVLNRVPYGHNGSIAEGCAPRWNGKQLDWRAWDRRFGPYLDGSAFDDLPRSGVPLECFYLPLFENWPSPMDRHYNGDYWADRAFPEAYRRGFVEVARQMAEHFEARGWHDTLFQCFLNNKNDYKQNGWSRASSPWLLDEPANFQDYWALRFFGLAFHDGVRRAGGRARMVFRCDISRPEWQRDALDDVLDYNVVGGAFRQYHRMVLDRKQAHGQIVLEYGSSNAVEDSNLQPLGWCLDAWSLGTDGVLPWQTLGTKDSWTQADRLSLFYPAAPGISAVPVPSIRLKAYRRGQQDVEYLTLWALLNHEPRWAVGQRVREMLRLSGKRHGTGFEGGEDAGVMDYAALHPQDAWSLRMRIGRSLSDIHPPPQRRLVDLRPGPREPAAADFGYAAGSSP